MIEKLIVFQKMYEFLFWIKPTVQRFAKAHKYSLGLQLETEVLELLKCIVRTNIARDKSMLIQDCLVRYETIKVLIRLSKDYKLISVKQYEYAATRLIEIGKLLGGWARKFGEKVG